MNKTTSSMPDLAKTVKRSLRKSNSSYYIYLHTRLDTGEVFYVGKGAYNEKHKYDRSRAVKKRTKDWHAVVSKSSYSIEIFGHYSNEDAAFVDEIALIKQYGREIDGGILVNLSHGGPGNPGCTASEETRDLLRAAVAGENHANWGKKLSAETCKRKSVSMANSPNNLRGKKLPAEWVKSLADAKIGALNPQFGRTGELSPISKRIKNTLTGEIYDSITLAAQAHGLRMKTLSGYLTGFRPNKTALVYL